VPVAEAIHCGPIAHITMTMTSAANSRSETRMTIHLRARVSSTVLVIVTSGLAAIAQQTSDVQQLADPDFKPTIEKPAYVNTHPVVVLDEAHANFHTASGRYKPFADLLQADGYRVVAGTELFSARALGRAQGLAFDYGRGRVVMMGEAAMFSAQVIRSKNEQGRLTELKMGMNVAGNEATAIISKCFTLRPRRSSRQHTITSSLRRLASATRRARRSAILGAAHAVVDARDGAS
jgi:hypothetical protein